jgi:hypothetical protein
VQVPHFFYKLPAVFEKYNLAPKRIFNVTENGIATVTSMLPKAIPENWEKIKSWVKMYLQIVVSQRLLLVASAL